MKFKVFAEYLEKLEKTPSRLEITRILTDLFKDTSSGEIQKTVYLSLGVLAPNYEGVLLNLAEKMVARAIAIAYKQDLQTVSKTYKEKGDMGDVAEHYHNSNYGSAMNKNLSVTDVYEKLLEIARDDGEGSADRKIKKWQTYLRGLIPCLRGI